MNKYVMLAILLISVLWMLAEPCYEAVISIVVSSGTLATMTNTDKQDTK